MAKNVWLALMVKQVIDFWPPFPAGDTISFRGCQSWSNQKLAIWQLNCCYLTSRFVLVTKGWLVCGNSNSCSISCGNSSRSAVWFVGSHLSYQLKQPPYLKRLIAGMTLELGPFKFPTHDDLLISSSQKLNKLLELQACNIHMVGMLLELQHFLLLGSQVRCIIHCFTNCGLCRCHVSWETLRRFQSLTSMIRVRSTGWCFPITFCIYFFACGDTWGLREARLNWVQWS